MKKLRKIVVIIFTLVLVQLLLVVLKITGVIGFPWWIVLGPVIATAAFVILTLLFTYLIAFVYGLW